MTASARLFDRRSFVSSFGLQLAAQERWPGRLCPPAPRRRRDAHMAGAPVPLTVTPTGKDWLGDGPAGRLQGSLVDVSRPSARAAADIVLLDSPNGPVLSASRLGGTGGLWRWGGFVRQSEVRTTTEAIAGLVRHPAAQPESRATIGLIQLESGPELGGSVRDSGRSWKARLDVVAAETKRQVIVIASPRELRTTLRRTTLAIVNPYGEWLPVNAGTNMGETVDAIGRFVREGGHWVETGGYSFYAALVPQRFLKYSAEYPPVFADFLHLRPRRATRCLSRPAAQLEAVAGAARPRGDPEPRTSCLRGR